MAIGALIGAYQEDDSGGLRALFPLAGRTLIEYQVRCAAAAGAAPVVVVVERVPQGLQDAFERLRLDGIGVFPVSDINEAVSRFEAGSAILLIGDGIVPPVYLVAALAAEPDSAVATVPDDEQHEAFERIDAQSRWAGVAVVNAQLLGSTAAMRHTDGPTRPKLTSPARLETVLTMNRTINRRAETGLTAVLAAAGWICN